MLHYLKQLKEKEGKDSESEFTTKLIEELLEYGIDTSGWSYKHGDCCDDAVEFMARCIKGYTVEQSEKEVRNEL